jgi:hypothetical protein
VGCLNLLLLLLLWGRVSSGEVQRHARLHMRVERSTISIIGSSAALFAWSTFLSCFHGIFEKVRLLKRAQSRWRIIPYLEQSFELSQKLPSSWNKIRREPWGCLNFKYE